jgi:hypothetical protein
MKKDDLFVRFWAKKPKQTVANGRDEKGRFVCAFLARKRIFAHCYAREREGNERTQKR